MRLGQTFYKIIIYRESSYRETFAVRKEMNAPVLPHDVLEGHDLSSHGEDQAGMVVDAVCHGSKFTGFKEQIALWHRFYNNDRQTALQFGSNHNSAKANETEIVKREFRLPSGT